jgi:hypothetical protein
MASMTYSSSTANTLRWRSRTAKEAVNSWDGDESVATLTADGKYDNSRNYSRLFGCFGYYYRPTSKWIICLDATAAIAAASSIVSLHVTNSLNMVVACTLTVLFSLIVPWQRRRLQKLISLRHVQNETRFKVNRMWQQNERLYRNLTGLDQKVDRLRKIKSDLSKLVGQQNVDTARLVDICQQWKHVNARIRDKLQQQVTTKIVSAVCSSDEDVNFSLSPSEMERLILQLQMIPGVQMDEALFRQQLVGDGDDGQHRSLDAVLHILRQVTAVPSKVAIIVPTAFYGGGGIAATTKKERSVFTFDPQQLRNNASGRHEC